MNDTDPAHPHAGRLPARRPQPAHPHGRRCRAGRDGAGCLRLEGQVALEQRERLGHADGQGRPGHVRHRQGRQLVQLAAVHRRLGRREEPPDPRCLHQGDRHQGQLHRGLQRQRRVLREGPSAARRWTGHRPRRLVLHRLDGGAADPPGLRAAARQGQHPQRQEPRGCLPGRVVRPGPQVLPAVAGGLRLHRLQHQGDGWQEGRDDDPAAHRPGAQGQGDAAVRDARHGRSGAARPGQGPVELHRGGLRGRDRR